MNRAGFQLKSWAYLWAWTTPVAVKVATRLLTDHIVTGLNTSEARQMLAVVMVARLRAWAFIDID